VRPHGRQGARAHAQFIRTLVAARLAADVMDVPTLARRPHRRRQREAPHQRRRRARPRPSSTARRSARPRASTPSRAASTAPSPAASPTPPTPTSSGARPPPPTSHRRSSSPRASTRSSRASSSRTTARRVQLEEEPRRRHHREVPARARGHGLQVPVRHAGGLPHAQPRDVQLAEGLQGPRHGGLLRVQQAEFAARSTATPPRATSARSARATSTVAEVISGGKASAPSRSTTPPNRR
jgi:hypothetical protein